MAKRSDFKEEMGSGYYKADKLLAKVQGRGKKGKSYEDDFDDAVSVDGLKANLDELKKAYKKARSESEKKRILTLQNKVRAEIQMMKEDQE